MSGVRKIAGIGSPARCFPNHADLFRNSAIRRSHWFPTRRHFWFFTQNACVFRRPTHNVAVAVTCEASRYGLLLPIRQDTRP